MQRAVALSLALVAAACMAAALWAMATGRFGGRSGTVLRAVAVVCFAVAVALASVSC